MKTLIAVYGTLRSGMWNNGYLAGQEFVRESVLDNIRLLRNYPDFPVAQWMHGCKTLVELYNVDDECLTRLDRLEGVPHMYKREILDVGRLYSEEPIQIYLGNNWRFDLLKECYRNELGIFDWVEGYKQNVRD